MRSRTGPATAASVASAAVAVLLVTGATPGGRPLCALAAVAVLWGTAPIVLIAVTARRPGRPVRDPDGATGDVTTLVRLGSEPLEVARTTVLLAEQIGPTAIVTGPGPVPDELGRLGVPVYRAETPEAAVIDAVRDVSTPAVHVVSARSVPVAEACRAAAGALGDEVGWIVGSTAPFAIDHFASVGREVVGARLRQTARGSGLDIWEPDATIVRTDLLRAHPLESGRPWGRWLRDRRAAGLRGERVDAVLALRAAPVAASAFWPDTVARQRATAADLSDAIVSGPGHRGLPALLLANELYVVPVLLWWVVAGIVRTTGELPVGWSVVETVALLVGLGTLRWWSVRRALHLRPRPMSDALSALYHLPGSLLSVPTAVTRRLGSGARRRLSSRPLVWAALLLTALTAARLVAYEPGTPVPAVAAWGTLVSLVALWAFALRALAERDWARSTYRIPLDLAVDLEGHPGRSIDGSPAGLSLAADAAVAHVATSPGRDVDLCIRLDDGSQLHPHARLVDRRAGGRGAVLGLAIDFDDASRERWVAQLLREVQAHPAGTGRTPHGGRTGARPEGRRGAAAWGDRVLWALVVAVSVAVLCVLALTVFGIRPFVVRSPSMTPTLGIGDVVLSQRVPVGSIRIGDIVTSPDEDDAESVTHRVRDVVRTSGTATVETQGDANTSGERWTVRADSTVGRVVLVVPRVGSVVAAVRTSGVDAAILALVVALVVWALLRGRPQRSSATRHPGG